MDAILRLVPHLPPPTARKPKPMAVAKINEDLKKGTDQEADAEIVCASENYKNHQNSDAANFT